MILTEKYKPNTLDEIIGQHFVKSYLKTSLNKGRIINLTFAGKPGLGKSATIVAYIKDLYYKYTKSRDVSELSILEINASDENSIKDNVDIKEFVQSKSLSSIFPFKFVILEEADKMSKPKQYALRRIIEKSGKNVVFFITCNYIGNIIPALLSRCSPCIFHKIEKEEMKIIIQKIINIENIKLEKISIEDVIRFSDGDCRKAINLLEIVKSNSDSDIKSLMFMLSENDLDNLVESIIFSSLSDIDFYINQLSIASVGDFLKQLLFKLLEQPIDAEQMMKSIMIIQACDYKSIKNNEYKLQLESCIYQLLKVFRGDDH